MKSIQQKFKLKNDAMVEHEIYLGAELSKIHNRHGDVAWAMSSEKYCDALLKNVEGIFEKRGLRLTSKVPTSIRHGYNPELDVTAELKTEGMRFYQELIGQLRWAIELGRIDILHEVSIMSSHLTMPHEDHLEQIYYLLGYLKVHKEMRICFDGMYSRVDERQFTRYDCDNETVTKNVTASESVLKKKTSFYCISSISGSCSSWNNSCCQAGDIKEFG